MKLFIIGGGNRSNLQMNKLVSISDLKPKDYILILPMAIEEPDSAFYYLKRQVNTIAKKSNSNSKF